MGFKKVINSKTDGMFIIGSSDKSRYPVGFEYLVGKTIYRVREDVTKDTGSEMRRVVTSDGNVEIMTLESIDLDLKESDAQVLNDGKNTTDATAAPEVVKEEIKEEPKKDEEKSEYDGIEW